ncbi:hypothetical protein A2997_00895 [Candidatus Nomurabacteria bacterium RIFCSPLOWO2_01_FULL_36_10b]|uniref:50S ribosomal protein L35 n=1 Tax=Candidatus Nomurabacteria bacterium RIFCSPLOWO2_01_FULL_36_10b TaxID=1801766 RepID=A0A1F6WQ31_9BACT|nr:MAG: hypothetical protein A2997_00895 [Candidatus Nomurabacteria bacterium RIFCSPLOWO2_01_FULL_36_10b]
MALKTNKAFTKRFKLTKNGKLKGRKPGFNHFNAKQSRAKQLSGKVPINMKMKAKDIARYFPYN